MGATARPPTSPRKWERARLGNRALGAEKPGTQMRIGFYRCVTRSSSARVPKAVGRCAWTVDDRHPTPKARNSLPHQPFALTRCSATSMPPRAQE